MTKPRSNNKTRNLKKPRNNFKTRNLKKKLLKKKKTKTRRSKKLLPIVYGKLYMTGCIHCEKLAPEWEIVNNALNVHSDVVCYDIERLEESTKLHQFNNMYKPYESLQVQDGYPTIYKLHKRGGAIIYYNGPRDNVSILKWLQG
jgi:hypothetical protein